jgi:hypothetical protein
VQVSGLIPLGQELVSKELFLEVYDVYIQSIKFGKLPVDTRIRPLFSSIWTLDLNAVYTVAVQSEKCLVKVCQPVIQLQAHRFDYSPADGKFRSMVMGNDSIFWGIQFSYPHLFQDSELNVFTVREEERFPTTALFKRLQRWTRHHTMATSFEIEGKKINIPIRLGKACLPWINRHPQLISKKLRVV